METQFKTVSFGGYDKKAVDAYIEETVTSYENEIATLKANATKLSDTVKNLHTMREVNLNESKGTIDNLKSINEKMQTEIDSLKKELEAYKTREFESASRYESISRTLLAARESADSLTKKTSDECEAKLNETNEHCQKLIDDTTAHCDQLVEETTKQCDDLKATTTYDCNRLTAETTSSCQEKKESTYAECDNLRRRTKYETDELTKTTQDKCNKMIEEVTTECDNLKASTQAEVYNTRMTIKKECQSIKEFISQLMVSVEKVSDACEETKTFAESAFGDISSQS